MNKYLEIMTILIKCERFGQLIRSSGRAALLPKHTGKRVRACVCFIIAHVLIACIIINKFPLAQGAQIFSCILDIFYKIVPIIVKILLHLPEIWCILSCVHIYTHWSHMCARVHSQTFLINSGDHELYLLKFSWRSDIIWMRYWGVLPGNTFSDGQTDRRYSNLK